MKKSRVALVSRLGCGGFLLLISPCLAGFFSAMIEDLRYYPGKKEFEIVNHKIDVYDQTTRSFGDTAEAVKMAGEFSDLLEAEHEVAFTGGSKFTPATMGQFLTYCDLNSRGIVMLCQVPDLRGYKDEVRDGLAQLAWTTAQIVARKHHLPDDMPLVVGLRGFAVYGPIWEGKVAGEPSAKNDGLDHREKLYPYFIPEPAK